MGVFAVRNLMPWDTFSMHAGPKTDADQAAATFFERAVCGAIRFCGQTAYMFRFLCSHPSTLPRMVSERDERLPPPLSFLTVGIFVTGMVQRIAYAIDYGQPKSSDTLATEFHNIYGDISIWEVSLRTFPGILLVVFLSTVVARLACRDFRFDRNPIVATACYTAGLHALAVGFLYLALIVIETWYSNEHQSAIGYSLWERILTLSVLWTGIYGAMALALSIRGHAQRPWIRQPLGYFPVGTIGTLVIFAVIYMTVEFSFDIGSAQLRRDERFLRHYLDGFRISLVEKQFLRDTSLRNTQTELTLALTNLSEERILVPRHEFLSAADSDVEIPVVANSIDSLSDKSLMIEPQQTRVIRLRLDMSAFQMDMVEGEISKRVKFPFHKAALGYAFNQKTHYVDIPLPDYMSPVQNALKGLSLPQIGQGPLGVSPRQTR